MMWLVPITLGIISGASHEILQKRALNKISVLQYIGLRSVFMLVFLFGLLPLISLPSFGIEGILILFSGICIAVGTIFFNKAVKHEELSTIQPLANIHPLMVTVLAFFLLDEVLSLTQAGGIFLLLVGTYVLHVHSVDKGFFEPFLAIYRNYYTKIAVIALLFFSFAATSSRFVTTSGVDPISYTVLSWITSCFFLLVYVSYKQSFPSISGITGETLGTIALPAFLLVVMDLFFYYSVSIMSVGVVTALFRVSNLLATVEGGLMFHESNLLQKGVASAVMVAGAGLIVLF